MLVRAACLCVLASLVGALPLPAASQAAVADREPPAKSESKSELEPASPEAAPAPMDEAASGLSLFSPRLIREFYAGRDFQLAWSPAQAEAMLGLANASVEHGLQPADFHAEAIRALIAASRLASSALATAEDATARWRADLLLSDALLRYLHHLQYGKHNPRHLDPDWTFVDAIDAAELRTEMQTVLTAEDLQAAVLALLPAPPFYEQLKAGYARYRALSDQAQAEGGWRPIPSGPNLKIGMRDGRVPRIREQVAVLDGERFAPPSDPEIYDKALYESIRELQGRSGLAQDGVIGPRTLAALNQPLDQRLAAIRANLERMRWLYHDLPPDYVFVDIAAFQVELMRNHEPVWSTRAVVGTGENQTPMFRDEMDHLVFNPTWSVPSSIQKKMRGVPSDYRVIDRRSGRRVYPSNPTDHRRYRLVQQPGPRNALGRVKFMFPNGHAIYLHDTPSRHLFARSRRPYSHGCVRVQDPLDLAREVLVTQNWDATAIERVVANGRTRYVNLNEHLPVLLYYLTTRADERGRVGFRDDVYERDARLLAALEGPPGAGRIVFREPPEPEPVPAPDSESEPMPLVTPGTSPGADELLATTAADKGAPAAPSLAADDRDAAQLLSEDETPAATAEPAQGGLTPEAAPAQSSLPEVQAWWGLSVHPQAASTRRDAGQPSGLEPMARSAESNSRGESRLEQSLADWRARDLGLQAIDARQLDLRPLLIGASDPGS